jgi:hypothetical protein
VAFLDLIVQQIDHGKDAFESKQKTDKHDDSESEKEPALIVIAQR